MRKYLVIAMVLTLGSVVAHPQQWAARVTKVIDGNTLEILTSDNETYQVKLKNIDCPEIEQAYGEEAKKLTEKLLLKKKVKVVIIGKDRWGNRLADITLSSGKDIDQELLKKGYAWHNTKRSNSTTLKSLEVKARNERLGLWEDENPTPPWIFRRQQTMKVAKSR